MATQRALIIILCSTVTASCGVTLNAKRVGSSEKWASVIAGEGIVYALPRTDFEIVQPVNLKVKGGGAFADIIDGCERACVGTTDNVTDKSCDFKTGSVASLLVPAVTSVTRPDPSRLYQVEADAGAFQMLSLKFEVAESGVIQKAESTASNQAYEIVTSAVNTGLKVFPTVLQSRELNKTKVPTSIAYADCFAVSTAVAAEIDKVTGKLQCPLVRAIRTCMKDHEKAIADERDALDKLHDDATTKEIDPDVLAAVAANHQARIQAAVAKRNSYAALYGIDESTVKEASYRIVIPVDGPEEFKDETEAKKLADELANGTARVEDVSEGAGKLRGDLIDLLKKNAYTYDLVVEQPLRGAGDEKTVGAGYKYRVPVQGSVSLTVRDAPNGAVKFGPAVDQRLVAQYGAIASLPSHFKGKGGKVVVKHWENSGGIQTVEIGADPMPTSAVTEVIDTAYGQYEARQNAKAAKAAAAAAADPELDALSRQEAILALRKKIKDLEDALDGE